MSKGDTTRNAILEAALSQASKVGLTGLSIGGLARDVGMSKSGLFAHFGSKEGLQSATLQLGGVHFIDEVVRPMLRLPRGEPRVRALFENWLDWAENKDREGGCVFVASTSELDDRPGPVRDLLLGLIGDWLRTMSRAASIAIEEGHFKAELDPNQFAFEMHSFMLAYNVQARLFHNPRARSRASRSFEELLERAQRASADI